MNSDKTNLRVFPDINTHDIKVSLNGLPLETVTINTLAFMWMLTWNGLFVLIEFTETFITYIGIFYKIHNKLPYNVLKIPVVYFAFVHPYILDGVEIYANTAQAHFNKLEVNNK